MTASSGVHSQHRAQVTRQIHAIEARPRTNQEHESGVAPMTVTGARNRLIGREADGGGEA